MYLRSNSALPVSFGSTAPLDIVGVTTFVYQFVSASLCRILYDLKLEVETAWLLASSAATGDSAIEKKIHRR